MASTRAKGNILEDVVALLHNLPGVKVERRVKLKSTRPGSSRVREIDVLLTSQVAGYQVKIAIECKNYKTPIRSEKIDCFLGKLADVGIPATTSIFITSAGYRNDALKLARESGMHALLLQGLDEEQLRLEVNAALQSVIFHLAKWDIIQRFSNMSEFPHFPAPFIVVDFPEWLGHGTPNILNFLYLLWRENRIPSELGEHCLVIKMPEKFTFIESEPPTHNALVFLSYRVTAYVGSIVGTTSFAMLRDATTGNLEKFRVEAKFKDPSGAIELNRFESEEDLSKFFDAYRLRTITRIKVPRIESEMSFWPPSKRAAEEIARRRKAGEIPTFEEIEGHDLSTAWEPSIYDEEPRAASHES